MLEMNNASATNEKLTLFAIEGESYREICTSGQCKLNDENLDPFFGPPNPDDMYMSYRLDFTLKDIIPNPNIGPKEKEFLEKFSVSMFGCKVNDIIEDNGQEIYICNGTSVISREFDSRSWDYGTNAIFDAKKNTLRAIGNYTGSR